MRNTFKGMDPNPVELIRPMMSDRLGYMWDHLYSETYFEISPSVEKSEMVAYELRRQHPELFNLKMAGDCWVWCSAIPYMHV